MKSRVDIEARLVTLRDQKLKAKGERKSGLYTALSMGVYQLEWVLE